jgi:hypothetical protein
MKKLFVSALLAVSACGLAAAPAFAHAFGLFTCGNCCKGCCTFCVRQYNAFSPACCGSICCDGCPPFCYGGGPPGPNPAAAACGPEGCIDGAVTGPDSVIGQLLPEDACCDTPATPPAAPAGPAMPPASPAPAASPKPVSQLHPYGMPYAVRPAGYYPAPAYPPTGYYPPSGYQQAGYYPPPGYHPAGYNPNYNQGYRPLLPPAPYQPPINVPAYWYDNGPAGR